jgi:hypothetical protein
MKRIAPRILLTLVIALPTHAGLGAAPAASKLNTPPGLAVVELTLRRIAKLPKGEPPAALATKLKPLTLNRQPVIVQGVLLLTN